MFSYEFYVVLHVTGILLTFVALGGLAVHSINGGTRATNRARAITAALHGTGLLFVLVAGFGLMARTGIMHGTAWPTWLLVKMAIWLVLGFAVVLLNRMEQSGRWLIFALPALGVVAAAMAMFKPFTGAAAAAAEPPAAVAGEGSEG
jgi:uncharacterized membrane protein SirB2